MFEQSVFMCEYKKNIRINKNIERGWKNWKFNNKNI